MFPINNSFRCKKSRFVRQKSTSGKQAFKRPLRTKFEKSDGARSKIPKNKALLGDEWDSFLQDIDTVTHLNKKLAVDLSLHSASS